MWYKHLVLSIKNENEIKKKFLMTMTFNILSLKGHTENVMLDVNTLSIKDI